MSNPWDAPVDNTVNQYFGEGLFDPSTGASSTGSSSDPYHELLNSAAGPTSALLGPDGWGSIDSTLTGKGDSYDYGYDVGAAIGGIFGESVGAAKLGGLIGGSITKAVDSWL